MPRSADHVAALASQLIWGRCRHTIGGPAAYVADGFVPMYWALCQRCGDTDLYTLPRLLLGEWCYACYQNEVAAGPHLSTRMVLYPGQEVACSAFLLGGLDAVAALTQLEVACGSDAHVPEAQPEES